MDKFCPKVRLRAKNAEKKIKKVWFVYIYVCIFAYTKTGKQPKTKHTMETITITHRIINGKSIYNKRFDNYDKGFYGEKISKAEYIESRQNPLAYEPTTNGNSALNIVERVTYYN